MEERLKQLEDLVQTLESRLKEVEDEQRFTKEFTSTFSGTQGVANTSI